MFFMPLRLTKQLYEPNVFDRNKDMCAKNVCERKIKAMKTQKKRMGRNTGREGSSDRKLQWCIHTEGGWLYSCILWMVAQVSPSPQFCTAWNTSVKLRPWQRVRHWIKRLCTAWATCSSYSEGKATHTHREKGDSRPLSIICWLWHSRSPFSLKSHIFFMVPVFFTMNCVQRA